MFIREIALEIGKFVERLLLAELSDQAFIWGALSRKLLTFLKTLLKAAYIVEGQYY